MGLHEAVPRPVPKPAGPYSGWRSWCDQEWDMACETDADCDGMADPVGHPLYCGRPRWASEKVTAKVCRPGRFGRARRRIEVARQRTFVDHVCHPPDWYEPGTKCWQYKWKRAKECKRNKASWCRPDSLQGLLRVVALREATWKPYARHRLNPDIRANASAWMKRADRYGWAVELDKTGAVTKTTKLRNDANPHYGDWWRWSKGLGWYGHNTAVHLPDWDEVAPPEVLCREVEASEAYLRAARRAWRKIASGLDCDKDGERDWYGSGEHDGKPMPTWADVHQGASGGKLCPLAWSHERFAKRAKRAKLDPNEAIGLGRLGEPIPRDRQNEIAAEIRAVMPTL